MSATRCLLLLAALAACGGSGPSTPPPSGGGSPSSVSIAAGDQQSAPAGGAVTIAPAVVVRDAEGAVLSGIAVSFVVTSGGGSVQGASATTNASGLAAVGGWTLGASGDQQLEARVGALPAVVFHATIAAGQSTQLTVGPAGGNLTITDAGNPSHGFAMQVPAGSFSSTGSFTFRVDEHPTLPSLPAGFEVAGPVLEVSTTQLRSAHLMTLDVPITAQAGRGTAIAFRDPARGVMEIMPMVARSATSIRVLTGHLNASLLLGPTPATLMGAGLSSGSRLNIGQLFPISFPVPVPPVASVINLQLDRWPVRENGTWFYPDGHGPAIPALQALASADGGAKLGTLFEGLLTPGIYPEPAPMGILAMTADRIADGTRTAVEGVMNAINTLPHQERDQLAYEQIAASLATSKVAEMLAFLPSGGGEPQYANLISTGVDALGILQPSQSGADQLTHNSASGFAPYTVHPTIDGGSVATTATLPVPSFIAPFEQIREPLARFRQIQAMLDRDAREEAGRQLAIEANIPDVSFTQEAFEGAGATPVSGSSVVVRGASGLLNLRLPPGLTNVAIKIRVRGSGEEVNVPAGTTLSLTDLLDQLGTSVGASTTLAITPMAEIAGQFKQITATLLDLFNAPFKVSPEEFPFEGGDREVAFAADIPEPPSSYAVQWTWGDGESSEVSNSPEASHTYAVEDSYEIVARMLGEPATPGGPRPVLGVDTVHAVAGKPFWRLETITDPDGFLDLGDPGESGEEFDAIYRAFAAPHSALIAIDAQAADTVLRLRVRPSAVWASDSCCPTPAPVPGGEKRVTLGVVPAMPTGVGPFFAGWESNFWTQSAPGVSTGTLTSRYALGTVSYIIIDHGTQLGPRGAVRLEATRDGTSLTGTITFTVWWLVDDEGVQKLAGPGEDYRLPFTATRIH